MLVGFKRRYVKMREEDRLYYYFRQLYKRNSWLVFRQADTRAGLATGSEWYIGGTVLMGGQWLFFQPFSKQNIEQRQSCAIKIRFIPIHIVFYSTKSMVADVILFTLFSCQHRGQKIVEWYELSKADKNFVFCWLVYKILYLIRIIIFSRPTRLHYLFTASKFILNIPQMHHINA